MYLILETALTLKSRYFEEGYNRCSLRNSLSQFWTTESVIDHKAKEGLNRQSDRAHSVFLFRY